MRTAKTQLDEEIFLQIKQSGKTVYQYLREAVEQKINNEQMLNITELMEVKLRKYETRQLALLREHDTKIEDKLLEAVLTINNLIKAQIDLDNELKGKFNIAFSKILQKLNQGD